MRLHSYLSVSRHGIYYFRYPITTEDTRKRSSKRISLKTRHPETAKSYALRLRSFYITLKENGIFADMEIDRIHTLIVEHFDDMYRRGIEHINQNGFSTDSRNSHKEAIRRLKFDIKTNDGNALDMYTQIDGFKQTSRMSNAVYEQHSQVILPLLREFALKYFTKAIEYGDAKNKIELDRVLSPSNVDTIENSMVPQQDRIPLKQAIKEFIEERSKLGAVGHKHIDGQKGDLDLLTEIVGDQTNIQQFNGALVREVKNSLIELPKNRKKNALTRNLVLKDAIKVHGVDKINGKTVNGYLGTYRTFFKWMVENKYLETNPFETVRVEVKKKPRQQRRQAYTQEALEITYNALCSDDIKRDSYKWAVLIGMFTGARLAEICQLEIADIQKHDGIICFDINSVQHNERNLKHLKSDAAHRLIPMHSKLQELGIGNYARSIRSRHGKDSRLFPDFAHHRNKGYTKNFGRWYRGGRRISDQQLRWIDL